MNGSCLYNESFLHMNRNINGLWPYVRKVADIIELLGTSRNSSCLFQLESDSERVRWKKISSWYSISAIFSFGHQSWCNILALKSTGKQYDISIFEKLGILKTITSEWLWTDSRPYQFSHRISDFLLQNSFPF